MQPHDRVCFTSPHVLDATRWPWVREIVVKEIAVTASGLHFAGALVKDINPTSRARSYGAKLQNKTVTR
jgi:hypothetical protein